MSDAQQALICNPNPHLTFLLGLMAAASGLVSAPLSLFGGLCYGLFSTHPFRREAASLAKLLLPLSVVLLGFGMDLGRVLQAGRSGLLYTAGSIAFACALGLLLGRLLAVRAKSSFLITMGTAICGGSAIAALAPVLQASEEEISVAMGTVFLLNSLALLVFPHVGWRMHLSQNQFGLWAALAIHDTSSVVGAGSRFGEQALAIGTTVKLARALWIIPVGLLTAFAMRRGAATGSAGAQRRPAMHIPWFIVLFVLASVLTTYVPHLAPVAHRLAQLGRAGLTATLFLIGTSLSRQTLRQVGALPLLQGFALWLAVGSLSLLAVYRHWIAI